MPITIATLEIHGWIRMKRANEFDHGMIWRDPRNKCSWFFLEDAMEIQKSRLAKCRRQLETNAPTAIKIKEVKPEKQIFPGA